MTEQHLRAAAAQLRAVVQWIDNAADTIATAPEPNGPIVPPDVLTEPEPVRRDHLPTTPPPEYEFFRWADGDTLSPGDRPRINGHPVPVVRRLVTYGDWEPVTPAHWAADQPPRLGSHVGATGTTSPTDKGQPVQNHARTAHGHTAARDDALRRELHTLATTWAEHGQHFAADDLRAELDKARTTNTTEETP